MEIARIIINILEAINAIMIIVEIITKLKNKKRAEKNTKK